MTIWLSNGFMVVINGKRFARIGAPDATADGYYKAGRNGVHLYDDAQTLQAYVVGNRRQGWFVVSATAVGSEVRYMFGLVGATESWLGIDGANSSYEVARSVCGQVGLLQEEEDFA